MNDETVDQAARQVAISLMRLNEAIDLEDAERYSSAHRWYRERNLHNFYRKWFTEHARED